MPNPFEAELQRRGTATPSGNPFEAELARRQTQPAPAASPYPSFDVRQPPMQRMHEQTWPTSPQRPPMPDPSGGAQQMDFSPVVDFAKQQAQTTEAHYRNLANLPGAPFAGMIDEPSPEQQQMYMQEVLAGALTAGGGLAGRAIGSGVSDAVKYLGRGFRTIPGAERFLAREGVRGATGKATASVADLFGPAVSGAIVSGTVDALDPGPHELVDDTIATGAGVTTAAAVGKNTIDDLLVGNPRWRNVMMRPSSGTASAALGALIGYFASKGISATGEMVNDAANYVAGLFGESEPTP